VYREQINVRLKRKHYTTTELRAMVGSGANEIEKARLKRVLLLVLEHEVKNPLKAEQARAPVPVLPLRGAPQFPDSQASALDKAHPAAVDSAVEMAAALVQVVAPEGQFHANRSAEPVHPRRRKKRKEQLTQQRQQQNQQADSNADLEGQSWHDPAEDGGDFMVLKAAWDAEFDQPIVYYFDTVAAAAAGVNREQLMTDLQHPVVAWSSVTDVVGWINDCS
jgi:hypothetical protein